MKCKRKKGRIRIGKKERRMRIGRDKNKSIRRLEKKRGVSVQLFVQY